MKIFSDRINQLRSFTHRIHPPHINTHSRCYHFKHKTFKLWFLDSWPGRKTRRTNLRSLWDIIIHSARQLSSCLPARRPRPSKWRGNLDPNANTVRENQLAGGELRNMLSCFFPSSGKSTCGRRSVFAESQLSFQSACISCAAATVKCCALVWRREVLLGASWGRTTAARRHGAPTKPTLCMFHVCNAHHYTCVTVVLGASWGYYARIWSCFVAGLLRRCVERCHEPKAADC